MKFPRKTMSFDLRQRCRTTSELIEITRRKKPLRILDGGGREGYLHNYLPEDEIVNLDRSFFSGEGFVVGDLLLLPFGRDSFDMAISLDVLEHIDADHRDMFLTEIDRVSRDGFIIGAPFFDQQVVEAEKLANDFYLQTTGRENEFLAEHLRLGLPELAPITSWIESRGYNFVILPNNYLPFWMVMMGLSAYFSSLPRGEDLIRAMTDLYDHILARYDCRTPSYRKIILVSKTLPLDEESIQKRFAPPPAGEDSQKRAWDFADRVLTELISHQEQTRLGLGEKNRLFRTQLLKLEESYRAARGELEGIKSTPAYRIYQKTWGRFRGRGKQVST